MSSTSTYRIFINGTRVSTAVALENGSYLQVYPHKDEFADKASWLFAHVMVREDITIVDPEGISTLYKPETYTLLYDDCFAESAGVRIMKEFYLQWFPQEASFRTRDALLAHHMKEFGTGMELRVIPVSTQTVLPHVDYTGIPVTPKAKVSAWSKMTEEQRKERLNKMSLARKAKKERRESLDQEDMSMRFLPNPYASPRSSYWDPNDTTIDPVMRNLLSHFAQEGVYVARSGEGCECGNC